MDVHFSALNCVRDVLSTLLGYYRSQNVLIQEYKVATVVQ